MEKHKARIYGNQWNTKNRNRLSFKESKQNMSVNVSCRQFWNSEICFIGFTAIPTDQLDLLINMYVSIGDMHKHNRFSRVDHDEFLNEFSYPMNFIFSENKIRKKFMFGECVKMPQNNHFIENHQSLIRRRFF